MNAFSECSTQSPLLLFLGIGVTLMAWGLLRLRDDVRISRARLLGVSASSTHPLRVAALCCGLLLMLSALARPYCGIEKVEVPYFGTDRVIVFDVSQSMLTRDLGSTRLAVAKRKATDYVRRLVEEGRSDRIGLVLFAGNAYQYCPLTNDHTVLKQFIENISPNLVASLGSNLAAGLEVALQSLKRAQSRTGEVLVISDGESGSDLNRQRAGLADLRVIVDALGVGTTRGKPIELEQGRFLRDERNEIVVSRLESAGLEQLAKDTGGRYTTVTASADGDLDVLIGAARGRNSGLQGGRFIVDVYHEFGSWLLVPALLLLFAGVVPSWSGIVFRFVPWCFLVSSLSLAPHVANAADDNARAGYLAYEQGDYESAERLLGEAHKAAPSDDRISRAYASSLFRQGRARDAAALFGELAAKAQNGRDAFEALYNQGTALLSAGDYDGSITALESALQRKQDDPRAQSNLAYARRMKALRPTPTPPPPQSAATPSPAASPSPQPEPSPSPKPESSPSETASATVSPEGSATAPSTPSAAGTSPPSGTPSAAPTTGPAQPDGTPSAAPSGEPSSTKSPLDQVREMLNGTPSPSSSPSPRAPAPAESTTTPAGTPPTAREANAWLDSLPETPLLLRRNTEQMKNRGQTW